jgi:hypothetical protein
MTTRDQLIQKLGAAILNDEGLMEEPWKRLVLIVKFFETSSRLKGVAILESGDDAPVTTENDGNEGVASVLEQLRKLMAKEDKSKPFVACLIRVAKDSGEMDIDFEHKNRDRWDYDPRDRAGMRATLNLDD